MKTPICTFDAKTSILCTKYETKLRLGQLTHADVDGAMKIAKLAEGSQDVNNFTMLGAYKVDDDFILTLRNSDINILRTHPSILRKFEIVVPLTGNSFHNIFSYAQTTDTTAKHGSLNNTFHSAFDTFVVPRCKI